MKPIKIRIRKKTKVLTKYQCNHKYRSDWKLVGVIDYNDSFNIFKSVNGGGVCETEGQFAKLIHKNYGPGEYSCIAWIKGIGDGRFFSFWKAELNENGFKRLAKNISAEQKEKKENLAAMKKIKKQLESEDLDPTEKAELQDEINELAEDNDMNDEIMELDGNKRRGPSGYLKCATPVYRQHEYQSYGKEANTTEAGIADFW